MLGIVLLAVVLIFPGAAAAELARKPWPPIPPDGLSFIHYGEEHLDDEDGMRILPRVVRQSVRYRPDLVTMSGDKASDSSPENLTGWRQTMDAFDKAGIPYFAAVGNHDRSAPGTEGLGSIFAGGDFGTYSDTFADRAYPFGDAPPPNDPRFSPSERPPDDPAGASSHYAFSFGAVRWIVLDNSCFSFFNCDPFQSPPFPDAAGNSGTYDFLASEAATANELGQLAFVVMHMPTQDPRPGHSQPTPSAHTMGEGTAPDNAQFEQAAAAAGVDGVFLGHVKGMWKYTSQGVPYFTDGGAGGEVYVGSGEETGVDYGYWHGFRTISVRRGNVVTDAVPVFARNGIEITGPRSLEPGEVGRFSAVGQQPTEHGPDVMLELRDPDPTRPNVENLPSPARIWTTRNRRILSPIAASIEDERRRFKRRQTVSGAFRARCPGRTFIRVTSGWETERVPVRVEAAKGSPATASCP